MSNANAESPPPYEFAADREDQSKTAPPVDSKQPLPQEGPSSPPFMAAGPSHVPYPGTSQPRVYYYMDPVSGDQVASLLPPDHPQMICLREGQHVTKTQYGLLGLVAAILWFPLGIGLCLVDRKTTCVRCGAVLHNGVCA
ncbi:hypothetical protein BD626DRAFT_563137 [Schizophyllum amplum]|uniref:Uncharacterized protein n=1 Tax=Schizophyllum amplum TaxID=97359 RepID=A0A550CX77_9AGAR|nr:hypothetical protein BD626DRAFT_563137 [Auriculariopsis ampla]